MGFVLLVVLATANFNPVITRSVQVIEEEQFDKQTESFYLQLVYMWMVTSKMTYCVLKFEILV